MISILYQKLPSVCELHTVLDLKRNRKRKTEIVKKISNNSSSNQIPFKFRHDVLFAIENKLKRLYKLKK